MPAKILFRDAQGRDGAVELRNDPVWIGRSMDCAIRTDDAMVSRKHSMISFNQGRYWVEDLGSSNGTHVNDVKVQRQALNHNDVVCCGSLWLRYVEGANWDLEVGCLAELSCEMDGPLLLFDAFEGFPRGYRVSTNCVRTPRRFALANGGVFLPLNSVDYSLVHQGQSVEVAIATSLTT